MGDSAATAVLLVVGAGGFYAYQTRNNSTRVDSPAIHQISTPAVQSEPTGGGSNASTETPKETKPLVDEKRQVAAEEKVVRKQEKATKQKVADTRQEDKAAAEEADRARAEGRSQPEHPAQPENPDANAVDAPRPGQPPARRRVGNVVIRNFPDGTQVIVGRDGSRVVVTPDGRQQVIRPGQRVNRRRMRPRL